jgi:hypothetical protein
LWYCPKKAGDKVVCYLFSGAGWWLSIIQAIGWGALAFAAAFIFGNM